MNFFKPDYHSVGHCFGSFFLTRFIWRLGDYFALLPDVTMWQAAAIALLFGVAWECGDQSFAGKWLFDPRGMDGQDIAVDAVGCALALVI